MNQVFINKNNTIDTKSDSIKLLINSMDSLIHLPKPKQVVNVEPIISESGVIFVVLLLIQGSFMFFIIK